MAPIANGSAAELLSQNNLPLWLESVKLQKAVHKKLGDFKAIKSINIEDHIKSEEDFSSLMLRIIIEVEVDDGNTTTTSFILKTHHVNEEIINIVNTLQLLPKEEKMYQTIIPKFEALFKDKTNKKVKFAPQSFKFDNNLDTEYILLDDLQTNHYKNVAGATLNMEHMKYALNKLAEFHAASACYVEHHGMFSEEFTVSIFTESNRMLLKKFNASDVFLQHLKKWKNGDYYYQKLADSDKYIIDRLLELQKVNPREFNVLNHGDCCVNNIMFKYDASGNIEDAVFLDFQVGKYGSPANDLYYLILSSADLSIKYTEFDFFVRYYYDKLVENLKLLEYHRPLPKLRSLHNTLLKHGLAAYMVVSKVLPIIMLDRTDNKHYSNCLNDEVKMRELMYKNHKYVQAMNELLPWLDNRGLLDWK